jgi:hypothetical protein
LTRVDDGPSRRSDAIVFLMIGVWIVALAAGFTALWKYKTTAGPADGAPPEQWPDDSRIGRDLSRATIVMFAHPRCVCTRASLAELSHLMARVQDRAAAAVVFLRPRDTDDEWGRTDLWERASSIPGVAVLSDEDGLEARRFRAVTSGATLVYDQGGRLLFNGGITPSRGHEGDSLGQRRIVSLLTTGVADRSSSPVFGCALRQAELAETVGGEP